ncbi:hypothetical protein [Photobacterium sp. 53610]|uniref:hypothetical protein n=1 Tax=Photobacterium sp. 53610 TaxID=3102789 RepID=UPI002ED7F6D2
MEVLFTFLLSIAVIYLIVGVIANLVSGFFHQRALISKLARQRHKAHLSTQQMQLLKNIYQKNFNDNRVFELNGQLYQRYVEVCLNELKIESIYWPDQDIPEANTIEEKELLEKEGGKITKLEGVVYKHGFYVIRVDDFNILETLAPYFALPKVKKSNLGLLAFLFSLMPVAFLNLFILAAMDYDSASDFLFFCNGIATLFLLWLWNELRKNRWVSELTGKFRSVELSNDLFSSQGEINGFPVKSYSFDFKEDQSYTVHGQIKLCPEFHLDVRFVDEKRPGFSLNDMKKIMRWGMLIWFAMGYLFIVMTGRFYQSGMYQEYTRFKTLHADYQIVREIDTDQLSSYVSGDAIKFEDVYFSPGNEPGIIRASSELNETLIEQLTESIFSEVWRTIPENQRRESLDIRKFKSFFTHKENMTSHPGNLEQQLIAAKRQVLSQPHIRIDIGEKKFEAQTLSLKALLAKVFHVSGTQTITSNALYTKIKQAVIQYLYGAVAPMHASVSYFLPDEQILVVYLYQPKKLPDEVYQISVSMRVYRFWVILYIIFFLYSLSVYLSLDKRYGHWVESEQNNH